MLKFLLSNYNEQFLKTNILNVTSEKNFTNYKIKGKKFISAVK